MRFHSYMTAGALALMPMLAMAGQAGTAPAAQPMFVNVNGQAVPVKAETHVVQTAIGLMKVSTWSWHSPQDGTSFEMRTSSGGMSPAALQQMQAAQYRMAAAHAQMIALQQQMMALQQVALANALAMPMPQPVGFAMPPWAMPEPVVVLVPAQPPARSTAPTAPATPAARGLEIKA